MNSVKSRLSLPLVSLSALALAAALLGASVSSTRADTVASSTGGTFLIPFSAYTGQSFTTTTATAVNNVRFNYFVDVANTTPLAVGTGFLFSSPYTGTPADLASLSSATPGFTPGSFLGKADAAGGFYTFDSSLRLAPGTQYFFYENEVIAKGGRSGGPGAMGQKVYAGGVAFFPSPGSSSPTSNFSPDRPGFSANFLVTGSPVVASFSATGSLAKARYDHTATLLPNGKVLVAGGTNTTNDFFDDILAIAELYDPATGSWNTTGSLATARSLHTATLLPNGKVLVVGGFNYNSTSSLGSAELYDPATGSWSTTGSLAAGRYAHTATLLPNGKVLVAGGVGDNRGSLASAELYDPATGSWSATGSLATARSNHRATSLPNGKVLVAGGYNATTRSSLSNAELYDAATGSWSATGSLAIARYDYTATSLPNGNVLVAGGGNLTTDSSTASILASAELYDAATGSWSATGSLATARSFYTGTLLPNGNVLVAGGYNLTSGSNRFLSSAELYDPATGSWSAAGSLTTARSGHTATLLPNGNVLVAGGNKSTDSTLASAELYDTATRPSQLQNISTRLNVLTGDKVLIGGFIITGNAPKKVLLRAIGPSLANFGVNGALADPTLQLVQGGTQIASNDNWKINDATGQSQEADIQATTIPPTNDLESAIIATLAPGLYTAIVSGKGGGTGIGLVEAYDLDQAVPSQFGNISTRGFVDTGNNVMIGGFIVSPSTAGSSKVVVRAIGPSLTAAGVPDALQDPTLELHDGNGAMVAFNDNWQDDPGAAEVQANNLAPQNPKESALLRTLAPGLYTAIVAGNGNTTGVGVVEAYSVK